jgi:hypothetical protein
MAPDLLNTSVMKRPAKTTKLTLNRETIRELADLKLSRVAGAAIAQQTLDSAPSGGTHCKTTIQ